MGILVKLVLHAFVVVSTLLLSVPRTEGVPVSPTPSVEEAAAEIWQTPSSFAEVFPNLRSQPAVTSTAPSWSAQADARWSLYLYSHMLHPPADTPRFIPPAHSAVQFVTPSAEVERPRALMYSFPPTYPASLHVHPTTDPALSRTMSEYLTPPGPPSRQEMPEASRDGLPTTSSASASTSRSDPYLGPVSIPRSSNDLVRHNGKKVTVFYSLDMAVGRLLNELNGVSHSRRPHLPVMLKTDAFARPEVIAQEVFGSGTLAKEIELRGRDGTRKLLFTFSQSPGFVIPPSREIHSLVKYPQSSFTGVWELLPTPFLDTSELHLRGYFGFTADEFSNLDLQSSATGNAFWISVQPEAVQLIGGPSLRVSIRPIPGKPWAASSQIDTKVRVLDKAKAKG